MLFGGSDGQDGDATGFDGLVDLGPCQVFVSVFLQLAFLPFVGPLTGGRLLATVLAAAP